jgi:hypothetical protein
MKQQKHAFALNYTHSGMVDTGGILFRDTIHPRKSIVNQTFSVDAMLEMAIIFLTWDKKCVTSSNILKILTL